MLRNVQAELQMSLEDMELDRLMQRPVRQANSMAWLAWHIARLQDARAAALANSDQLWVSEGWHSRFGLPADPANHGRGHTDAEVDAVQPESEAALEEYARAAHRFLVNELEKLSEDEFASDASLNGDSGDATIGELVFRSVHGGLAHVGQLMYVRGLIENRRWFPR